MEGLRCSQDSREGKDVEDDLSIWKRYKEER